MLTKRLLVAFLAAVAGTLVLAAVGSGGTSKKQATPLPASSCSGIQGTGDKLIASDLPLQGAGRTQTVQMTKAVHASTRRRARATASARPGCAG